jgi:putative ABC transport system substrate-binding protein
MSVALMPTRREVLIGSAAVCAWPRGGAAQSEPVRRIALLLGTRRAGDPESLARIRTVRDGLAEHGWVEGRNLHVDIRTAAGEAAAIAASAAETVALAPDVIVANSNPVIAALARLTSTIPIVFAQIVDPVGLGVVKSLARPGGNATGFTFVDLELVGKWLQLLAEIAPGLARGALLYDPATTPFYVDYLRGIPQSSTSGAPAFVATPVGRPDDLETIIAELGTSGRGGLVVPPTPVLGANRRRIAEVALRHKVPSISAYRDYAPQGGLVSYGPDQLDLFRRATGYVDRILKGASPADLPVQTPTKYETIINARTAKALGLDVPPTMLALADEVIE